MFKWFKKTPNAVPIENRIMEIKRKVDDIHAILTSPTPLFFKDDKDDIRQKQQPGIKPAKSRSDSKPDRRTSPAKRPAGKPAGGSGVRKGRKPGTRKAS